MKRDRQKSICLSLYNFILHNKDTNIRNGLIESFYFLYRHLYFAWNVNTPNTAWNLLNYLANVVGIVILLK